MRIFTKTIFLLASLALAACQPSGVGSNTNKTINGVKVGKPYSVNGKTYYPAHEPDYDETGTASWYGPGFHGKSTANGERFNTHDLTAAHPTLPMPSLVRVTRQDTGESIIVRINDRGPFAKGRIIDLSKEAAQRLGIQGLAEVRVQYLAKETADYMAARKQGQKIDMAELNDRYRNGGTLFNNSVAEDQAEIVEANNNVSSYGSPETSVAPVGSISSSDLPAPRTYSGFFISDAVADEVPRRNPPPRKGGEVIFSNQVSISPPERIDKVSGVNGKYVIQAGSFASKANADGLRKKITAFAPATLVKVEVGNGYWWRVRAGPFNDLDDANSALDQVHGLGLPDAKVIEQ